MFHSEICRMCFLAQKSTEHQATNKVLEEKIKALEEKVKVLEDFVVTHIGPDAPVVAGNNETVPISDLNNSSYAAAVASASPITPASVTVPSNDISLRLKEIRATNSKFINVRNGAKKKLLLPVAPVPTNNSFGPLAKFIDEPEDSVIIGDSLVRHLLDEFCGRAPKCRKRYCYPGAKIENITAVIDEVTSQEKEDSVFIVHVGTNDIKTTRSEELMAKFKNLIDSLKEKRSKCIVSGILPRIGAESQFYSKAFSTNNRLRSLCSKENIEFVNLWDHFYDQHTLFHSDGLHLNDIGSARFGRLLNGALADFRAKNETQRETAAPP